MRFRIRLIDLVLNLFDQRQHIAHAKDALGHAIGIKRLERVVLLANADELYRLTSDLLDRQRRPATRIAVHLGQYDTRNANASMKFFRRSHGVLPGHRIRDEKDFHRMRFTFDTDQLFHQLVIDVQPAGCVYQKCVVAGIARML